MLNRQSLVFERRPGIPLPDTELEQEGIDLLEYGDDGDDEDFIPAETESDVPLVHENIIFINEIMDIQGPLPDDHLAIDSDSDSDESFYNTDYDVGDDESSQHGDDIHDEDHLSEINSQSNESNTKDPRSSINASATDFGGNPSVLTKHDTATPFNETVSTANMEEPEGLTLGPSAESSLEALMNLEVNTNAREAGASTKEPGANSNVAGASKETNMGSQETTVGVCSKED